MTSRLLTFGEGAAVTGEEGVDNEGLFRGETDVLTGDCKSTYERKQL